jgi:hypothetical protein
MTGRNPQARAAFDRALAPDPKYGDARRGRAKRSRGHPAIGLKGFAASAAPTRQGARA